MKKSRTNPFEIEEEFFRLDHEKKTAYVELVYDRPSDIFDSGVITTIPMMSEDFFADLLWVFDYLPEKYKLDIDVCFKDLEGYSEADLKKIFEKNIALELKAKSRINLRNVMIALSLCVTGLAFILLSIFINRVWVDDSILKKIVAYILDIMATVPFWGALDVCLVEANERRKRRADIIRRFGNIEFIRK